MASLLQKQLLRTSCPSLPALILIVINPLHMTTLVSVIGIPLYRLVIVRVVPRVKNVRMLTKMWMGLYLSLLQEVLYIIVVVNHDTTYWQQHHHHHIHHSVNPNETQFSPSRECYVIRTGCVFIYGLHRLDCQHVVSWLTTTMIYKTS